MTNGTLRCPACGSEAITLIYEAPVYVEVLAGLRVQRVVVADEDASFQGRAFCENDACATEFDLAEEPETLDWPAWELGF